MSEKYERKCIKKKKRVGNKERIKFSHLSLSLTLYINQL